MEAAAPSQLKALPESGLSFKDRASIVAALVCGLALRWWFFKTLFVANGDTLIYGEIAENLVEQGKYALFGHGVALHPTLIRLPGYPFFLAACFKLFGIGNYAAATIVQIALDLVSCLLIATAARHVVSPRFSRTTMHAALWLAALCPFTAVYAASPLTEGPTLFAIALVLWSAIRFIEKTSWKFALGFTFGVTWVALLRPDGVLMAVAFVPALLWELRGRITVQTRRMVLVCVLLAVAPFAMWTVRNAMVFHIFQPLVPRSAADPGSPTNPGWELWVKTWSLDFDTTYTIYWEVSGDALDAGKLPSRAFDSPSQRARTIALVDAYNSNGYRITPRIDSGFEQLAKERIAAHPLHFYLWLPLGRLADMWLRPRVDNLNIDLDWWNYDHHEEETVFSWFYVALNMLYLVLGIAGLCFRPRFWQAMLAYFILRSVLLASVAAPETRYTLECFPMLCILGGFTVAHLIRRYKVEAPSLGQRVT